MAREEFKEKLLLSNQSHSETSTTIRAWIAEREAYLQKKETVESVRDARSALTALELYHHSKADMSAGTVAAFHKLTQHLLSSKYETKLSTYALENPAEVKDRDEFVVGKWAKLDELYAAKLAGMCCWPKRCAVLCVLCCVVCCVLCSAVCFVLFCFVSCLFVVM